METDPPTTSAQQGVVSDSAAGSGLMVTLHPLVIMNISDQFIRTRAQNKAASPQVVGVLIGTQSGREIEIFNSYELPYQEVDGHILIDDACFNARQDQFKQVFPDYDLLGWYSTGLKPTPSDIHVHQQFLQYNESSLFLKMNPTAAAHSKDLPITIYESVVDMAAGATQLMFVKLQYKVETGEAERLAVEHVAHATDVDAGEGSGSIAHLTSQQNAIKMLHSRVKLLHTYVAAVEAGQIPRDHNIMRQISSMCNRLPTIDSPEFREELLVSHNDVLLMTYLADITKGTNSIHELVHKHNVVNERRQHHHRSGPGPRAGLGGGLIG
ncbi:COP9 signalosome complex subunit 6 [Rhizophlyctis rosea]|nr:COP9 signalosome complex subunit 6 [Rhizophlyctis rosea]